MRNTYRKISDIITPQHSTVVIWLIFNMLLGLSLNGNSQIVHSSGIPDANKIIFSNAIVEEISFDGDVIDSMRNAFYEIPGNTTFAIKREVNYNPGNSGMIIENEAGEKVWYLSIRSENAKSLNVIFRYFSLLKGEEVYIYNKRIRQVRGPFIWMNNKETGGLAVMPVAGEEIIIEYHMTAPGGNNRLEVGQVANDFIGISGPGPSKDIYYGSSQPCNVDINCESGDEWKVEKNSIVRIIAGGTELGSGFLVNNTRGDNIPFVITANHVIRTPEHAINSIYVFRYESPYCDGPDGMVNYSLSGAEMMAENVNTDFTIVRLDDFPPLMYKPYLAGWDVRGVTPSKTVTIHHPSGDVKKISTDNDPPVVSTFQDLYPDGFWKVLQWDEGTTEGGSSGSPLFDQNHRAVGLLTGGEAVCGNSVNDYFARMDVAYDISPDIYNSLKPWLDPAKTGALVLDGRDPFEETKSGFDTLCNCADNDRFLTEYDLPATGYTTGFNSDSIIMYAEKFTVSTGKELTEVIMEIGDSRVINNYDSITVFIMSGLTEPESVLARRSIFIRDSRDSSDLYFDFFSPVTVPEVFFVTWHLWYSQEASAEQQQFAVFHGPPVSVSENTAYFKDHVNWHPFYDHPYQPDPLNICVRVITADSIVYSSLDTLPGDIEMVIIYPNPASDKIMIRTLDTNLGEISYSVINNSGIPLLKGIFNSYGAGSVHELDVSELPPGIYYLTLENDYSYSVHKMIIK
ncbi:MAG: T9SS type A sorting domain-containing protein [Bacteroidota bacterium]|nr:T9SS type A sorting domain-containing protein [Bacteroidota bacterium]